MGSDKVKIISRVSSLLFQVAKAAPLLFVVSAGLNLMQGLIPGVHIVLVQRLVDSAAVAVANDGSGDFRDALWVLLLMAAVIGLTSVLNGVGRIVRLKMAYAASYHLDKQLVEKSTKIPLMYFDQPEHHNLLQRVSQGLSNRVLNISHAFMSVLKNGMSISTIIVILLSYHWMLGFIMFALALPLVIVNMLAGEWHFWQTKWLTPTVRRMNYLFRLLLGRDEAKEIRVFDAGGYLIELWSRAFRNNAREQQRLEWRAVRMNLVAEAAQGLGMLITIGFLVWGMTQQFIGIGIFAALIQAIFTSGNTFQAIALNLSQMYEEALFAYEFRQFTAIEEERQSGRQIHFPLKRGITVDRLSFQYPNNDTFSLRDISVEIPVGATVAIVGENGSGKSTLVKCLIGLYEASAGQVYYDDAAIDEANAREFRKHVAAIFQDFVHYQLTMRENVFIGNPDAIGSNGKWANVSEVTGIGEIASRLPNGLDTMLGPLFEGGHELSGGQWQKIALSRALIKDADVIILDEPTAAMDPIAEQQVLTDFINIAEGKTTLLISHRLGCCRKVDLILVLQDGRLVEQGNHEQLMAKNGHYAAMFKTQSQWYQEADVQAKVS
ncbi:ABC transporter ATP-binding protein [Paenibacillus xylaniclasticus]|uniref:ABC transporter ATP-binding protein n=1 Tax=Paenibacillus xylaniclasticus TaxID=588083 RepID=UPI000FDA660E|nr:MULTISPECIES: ABC transporter ATP-binding protein [Paenibacillus]